MAQLVRPLILSPAVAKWPLRRCINSLFHSNFSAGSFEFRSFFTGTTPSVLIHRRNLHLPRSRGLRPADAPLPSEVVGQRGGDGESDSSDAVWKSRNEKKREARRGVRWAMQLADFNESQIKRILRIASLGEEVFDALMLVKRLGRDVREGKRRQFSYIGRLLRDVQPELIDGLIQATKDGDQQKLLELSGSDKLDLGDTGEEEGETDFEDDDDEGLDDYHNIATRWFDGLVNKDANITNEIYSLSTVEFDRQELRKLVRNFCSIQERSATTSEEKVEGETDIRLSRAKRHLTRFLVALAKQLPTEENYAL
ncbi:hypothetical protein OSB04_025647 [Centaurea solstitialis]|uniref:Uncharacterized protein n=1 Tax=Centaurea solstitialis TaxID=347529 RepID=A0AA38SNG2_9ASTR|nr:hypothetical protein OSB04_025647 [Centaurea solstitialis]